MEYKDYYQILGVDRSASQKEIKSAYRKLTKKYHPDLNHGDKAAEVKYRDVNEAYEVLGDPDKRSKYDQFGTQWKYVKDGQTPPPGAGGYGGAGGFDFSDIFSQFSQGQGGGGTRFSSFGSSGYSPFFDMLFGNMGEMGGGARRAGFGGRAGRASARQPKTLESELTISLAEAYTGTTKSITLSKPVTCSACGGSGVQGQGVCPTCQGSGRVAGTHTIEVKVPAGVKNGSKIRVRGSKSGGDFGDIIFTIAIPPDPTYKLEGRDLRCDLWVPLKEALTGGNADLRLPNGKTISIAIKPGTQNGKVFRLNGLGLPNSKGAAGNILARLMVKLPEKLKEEELQKLIAALPV